MVRARDLPALRNELLARFAAGASAADSSSSGGGGDNGNDGGCCARVGDNGEETATAEKRSRKRDSAAFDVNKLEDLLLRVVSDYSLFAGIPRESRADAALSALERTVASRPEQFGSRLGSAVYVADVDLEPVRAALVQFAQSRKRAPARAGKALGRDNEPEGDVESDGSSSDDDDLQLDGVRVTRGLRSALRSTDAAAARTVAPTTPSASPTKSDSVAAARADEPPAAGARVTFPVRLAPYLFAYAMQGGSEVDRRPDCDEQRVQQAVIEALLEAPDEHAPVYRATTRPRDGVEGAAKRAHRHDDKGDDVRCVEAEYERRRQRRIEAHRSVLASLGLGEHGARRVGGGGGGGDAEPPDATVPSAVADLPVPVLAPAPGAFERFCAHTDIPVAWRARCEHLARTLSEQRACHIAVQAGARAHTRTLNMLLRRNDFAAKVADIDRVCDAYARRMRAPENRRKRRYRNVCYVDGGGGDAQRENGASRLHDSGGGGDGGGGDDEADGMYSWTSEDYRRFFEAWLRYGNDMHANKRIAAYMNAFHACGNGDGAAAAPITPSATKTKTKMNTKLATTTSATTTTMVTTARGGSRQRQQRQQRQENALIHPSHVAYQKRVHRGWLQSRRAEDELPLQQLARDADATCALCHARHRHPEEHSGAALIGPYWQIRGAPATDKRRRDHLRAASAAASAAAGSSPSTETDAVWFHRECVLWMPETFQTCDGTMMNVERGTRRALKMRCSYCRKCGAAAGCLAARCRRSYHAPGCARAAGCNVDAARYRLLCAVHARVQERAPGGCAEYWRRLRAREEEM